MWCMRFLRPVVSPTCVKPKQTNSKWPTQRIVVEITSLYVAKHPRYVQQDLFYSNRSRYPSLLEQTCCWRSRRPSPEASASSGMIATDTQWLHQAFCSVARSLGHSILIVSRSALHWRLSFLCCADKRRKGNLKSKRFHKDKASCARIDCDLQQLMHLRQRRV